MHASDGKMAIGEMMPQQRDRWCGKSYSTGHACLLHKSSVSE